MRLDFALFGMKGMSSDAFSLEQASDFPVEAGIALIGAEQFKCQAGIGTQVIDIASESF
jgi:hypothetical protein